MPLNIRDNAKPCSECGSSALASTETVDAKTFVRKGQKVACFNCGALGPLAADLHQSVVEWNAMVKPDEFMRQLEDQ